MRRTILMTAVLAMMGGIANAQGLKDVYKDYFKIGVAVNQRNVTNAQQQALVKQEFNSVTAENDMKPEHRTYKAIRSRAAPD
jgi:GH35 family endo-1,4-beta-xylanase